MLKTDIVIKQVSPSLLERQRLALASVDRADLEPNQAHAIDGIQNMLDAWSDERAGLITIPAAREALEPSDSCSVCGMNYESLDMAELARHDEHVVLRNEDAFDLVALIAAMTLEGECPECGYYSEYPNAGFESPPSDEAGNECPQCGSGTLFVMTTEDMAMTLNELIASARRITTPSQGGTE